MLAVALASGVVARSRFALASRRRARGTPGDRECHEHAPADLDAASAAAVAASAPAELLAAIAPAELHAASAARGPRTLPRRPDAGHSPGRATLARALPEPAGLNGTERTSAGFARLLARAQDTGEIRADVTAPDLTAIVKGLFAASVDARARGRLLRILLDGLRR